MNQIDPPPPPPPDQYPPRQPRYESYPDPRSSVQAPAVTMIVVTVLIMLLQFFSVFMRMSGAVSNDWRENPLFEDILNEPELQDMDLEPLLDLLNSDTYFYAQWAISFLISVFILYGAKQMYNLRNWGISMAASVVFMIPCVSPCCCLGFPVGIWSLIVLYKDHVQDAFH